MSLFVSRVGDNEPVITDANYQSYVRETDTAGLARGYVERDYDAQPIGSYGFAAPPPDDFLIPRSEWRDRIEEMEKTQTRLSDILRRKKVPYQDQARTNYCWAFGTIAAIHAVRALQNEPTVMLSPASVAAPMTRYANARGNPAGVGGWGTKALAYIVKNGVAPADEWPVRAIDPRYDNETTRASRKDYTVQEWLDLPPGRFDYLMSCVLRRRPAPIGLPWWGHLVCGFDPVIRGRDSFGVRARNSWLNYGDDGYFVLEEGRARPNDIVCPLVSTPSE